MIPLKDNIPTVNFAVVTVVLIALNVGYDLGILTPEIFAMMVLMALVTTAMTGPLLSLSLNWGRRHTIAPAGPLARSS